MRRLFSTVFLWLALLAFAGTLAMATEEEQVVEAEEELEDPFANLEVLSPMELAFQKAMGGEPEEVEGVTKKRSKRARRDQMRAIQDEIVSRTLDGSDRG